jgi:hypothetical protein
MARRQSLARGRRYAGAVGTSKIDSRCVVAVLVALAGFTGCGGSSGDGVASKSGAQILAASTAAAEHASSVHIVGESAQGRLKVALALELSREGGHSKVSLLGIPFEVIRADSALYVKGDRVFYRRLGLEPVRIPVGTWIKASGATAQSSQLASLATLRRETRQLLQATGSVTKGASSTVEGQPVIELKTSGRLYTGAIYVATTGQPYPVKLERHGRETSHMTFTHWNDPVALSAPTKAIEVSKLEAGGR